MPDPVRGEIWWVDFEPAIDSEPRFTRPAVVISGSLFDYLPVRVVVTLTSWQDRFGRQGNKVRIPRTEMNGLDVDSAADVVLVRSLALSRFRTRAGRLEGDLLREVVAGVAAAVDLTLVETT